MGRYEEALNEFRIASRIDPFGPDHAQAQIFNQTAMLIAFAIMFGLIDYSTVPVTVSSDTLLPCSNAISYTLPSRRIVTSTRLDRALTTEMPTPCKPPEN